MPPTADEVAAYCRERRSPVDPVAFWNFYASKDWMIGKNRMKNWRCAVVTWERDPNRQPFSGTTPLDPKAAAFERQRAEAEERKVERLQLLKADCLAFPLPFVLSLHRANGDGLSLAGGGE